LAVKNNGKKLESKTTATFKEFTSKRKGFYHRFVDKTQAMSGHIPASPGDYLLLVPGKAILVECKSTITGIGILTLAHKNKVQIATHRMWHRAKHPTLYVYWNLKEDIIEIHDGHNVVQKVNEPLITCKGRELEDSLITVIGLLE
jgi:hypothetical protein